ncbi:MAG: response regulator transcription factor [Burkholderiales bacterium]|nr:response regulator transcription factor [Burkholderiales bacterium]
MSILVVEDDDGLRESIVDALGMLGHSVLGVDCAEAVAEMPALTRLDMTLLDLNLPGEDGLSLARRLRAVHPALGIIMLTGRTQGEDRAVGYAQGADIYLTKPVSFNELAQAVGALSRRLLQPTPVTRQATHARLERMGRALVHADGTTHRLTANEAALIASFALAPHHTLENWQIAQILDMSTDRFNKSALELHIVRLRKKLPQTPDGLSPIQALRTKGYQLCVAIHLS